ncbi:hypothetical protein CAAN1_07S05270 [[Candida] anglica]|uniref:Uncharacterized protein n=1 Tax=[Candida] anglica TaxID=148631 RepID=A0ABP0EBE7_9ASCO
MSSDNSHASIDYATFQFPTFSKTTDDFISFRQNRNFGNIHVSELDSSPVSRFPYKQMYSDLDLDTSKYTILEDDIELKNGTTSNNYKLLPGLEIGSWGHKLNRIGKGQKKIKHSKQDHVSQDGFINLHRFKIIRARVQDMKLKREQKVFLCPSKKSHFQMCLDNIASIETPAGKSRRGVPTKLVGENGVRD